MFSAAEAVIEAAFAVHRKAGTFFIMKRAACPGRSSFLLQRNSSINDLVNVCSVKQFFNKRLCDQESNSHKKRRGTETVLKDPAAINKKTSRRTSFIKSSSLLSQSCLKQCGNSAHVSFACNLRLDHSHGFAHGNHGIDNGFLFGISNFRNKTTVNF